ncbi:hypothetical protein [Albimonas pacifica]|uniref:GDSL-like Lipase/Acylhydrolase family protein n=1 Tax=Albimonas pacifica TaxID=1114924 RepID=A0A1I3ILC9_9RHOB|nr:hypothetical protein [Albimonas pacifica]SFI48637.1 hypothetical protein SAMN05216258_107116 [Albimonas pacifica]
MGNMPIHVLGDSHAVYLKAAAEGRLLGRRRASFCIVPGATAAGMRNPRSLTDALGRFRASLAWTGPRTLHVIQLGEVDCGFVIWVRARRLGESIRAQLDASLDAYAGFVREAQRMGRRRIVITAATLPTIRDDAPPGAVAHARREATASLAERTALTFDYNDRLEAMAAALGVDWADATPDLLDPVSGCVAARFRNPDPADHHLALAPAAEVWADRLRPALARHDAWLPEELARAGLRRLRALRAA